MNTLPHCPKCGSLALEMSKGTTGWHWMSADGRSYHVGGKMKYRCACENEWEE